MRRASVGIPEHIDPDLRDRFTAVYRKALSHDFRVRYDNPGEMLKAWHDTVENVDERRKFKTSHPEMEERDVDEASGPSSSRLP